MLEYIGFDADDTLWEYEILYHRAKPQIVQLLGGDQDPEELNRQLDEIEIGNLPIYGYGIKSFALSMIEAAARLSNGPINNQVLLQLISLAQEMLLSEIELLQYTETTLQVLSERYKLILITKGELSEQERKIERSGIAGYFKHIEIVSNKTPETYRTILSRYGIFSDQFLMVGNSLKSDILPVVEIGGQAVYIPNEKTWIHEQVDGSKDGNYIQLEHLGQLLDYLAQQ